MGPEVYEVGGWEGGPSSGEGARNMCIHVADTLYCTAETNTTLSSNYTKKKKFPHKSFTRQLSQSGFSGCLGSNRTSLLATIWASQVGQC